MTSFSWMLQHGWFHLPGIILMVLAGLLVYSTVLAGLLPWRKVLEKHHLFVISNLSGFFILLLLNLIIAGHGGFFSLAGFLILHLLSAVIVLAALRFFADMKPLKVLQEVGGYYRRIPAMLSRTPLFDRRTTLSVRLLMVCVVLLAGYFLVLSVITLPLYDDSLAYRLARSALWLQDGIIQNYDTVDTRMNYLAHNAALLFGWLLAFAPKGAALVHVFSWLPGMLVLMIIYRLTREFFPRSPHAPAMAVLFFPAVPPVSHAFFSSQSDIHTAAFTWAGIVLLMKGLTLKNRPLLVMAACSIGAAVGTKGTVFYFIPGLVLFGLLFAALEKIGWKRLLETTVWIILGVLLLGSQRYLMNLEEIGNLIAPKDQLDRYQGSMSVDRLQVMRNNALLYAMQLFNPEDNPLPLQELGNSVVQAGKQHVQEHWLDEPYFADFPKEWQLWKNEFGYQGFMNELNASFGLIQTAVILTGGAVLVLLVIMKRGDKRYLLNLGLYCAAVLFLTVFSAMIFWTPHKFRYFVLIVPAFALSTGVLFRGRGISVKVWSFAAAALFIYLAVFNSATSNTGLRTVYDSQLQSGQHRYALIEEMLQKLSEEAQVVLLRNEGQSWVSAFLRARGNLEIRLVSSLPERLHPGEIALETCRERPPDRSNLAVQPVRYGDYYLIRRNPQLDSQLRALAVFNLRGLSADYWSWPRMQLKWIWSQPDSPAILLANPVPMDRQLKISSGGQNSKILIAAKAPYMSTELSGQYYSAVTAQVEPAYDTVADPRQLGVRVRLPVLTAPELLPAYAPVLENLITLDEQTGLTRLPFVQTPWEEEQNEQGSFTWLGAGEDMGLTMALHSESARNVTVTVNAFPSRFIKGAGNTLVFWSEDGSKQMRRQRPLSDQRVDYRVRLHLARGLNKVGLYLETDSQELGKIDGNVRPLAVSITSLTIGK